MRERGEKDDLNPNICVIWTIICVTTCGFIKKNIYWYKNQNNKEKK